MRLNFTADRYTLDWDNCSYLELRQRLYYVLNDETTAALKFRKSCRKKGYHVLVYTNIKVVVAKMRRKYWDDKKRLLHDILNRPDYIHDVLWTQKRIKGKLYKAGRWSKLI